MQRVKYIDALRGFTMILVVYSHVIVLMMNHGTNDPVAASVINRAFMAFRMPLFFFISGYFTFKYGYDFKVLKNKSIKRIIQQFIPTIVFGLLCTIVFFNRDIYHFFVNSGKYGYWFTIVAVEYFFTIAPILFMFSALKFSRKKIAVSLVLLATVAFFMPLIFNIFKISDKVGFKTSELLCLELYARHLLFFILGMIGRIYSDKITSFFGKKWVLLVSPILFILLFNLGLAKELVYSRFVSIAGVIMMMSLFLFFEKKMPRRCINWLSTLGTLTLEIYLLHYFVIYFVHHHVNTKGLTVCVNTLYEFPVVFLIGILIIGLCLLFVRLLKRLNIYKYLFLKYNPSTKQPQAPELSGKVA